MNYVSKINDKMLVLRVKCNDVDVTKLSWNMVEYPNAIKKVVVSQIWRIRDNVKEQLKLWN